MTSKLVGRKVYIKKNVESWASQKGGWWGIVKMYDGDAYHISPCNDDNITLIFTRDEFTAPREEGRRMGYKEVQETVKRTMVRDIELSREARKERKIYRQWRGATTDIEKITYTEAIDYLSRYYKNPEEVLKSSTKEHPIRTPNAYYWMEEVK